VEVRMKSKTRLSGSLARLHDTRLVGGGCGLWSVACGAAAGGEFGAAAGLLGDKGRYPRLDALTCICLCCPPSQREPVLLAAACLN
jgi:hypothetical protein